jgi:hypothetical protein
MGATKQFRTLEDLRTSSNSSVAAHIARLEMIQRQIKEECPDEVAWAVAFEPFLDRVFDPHDGGRSPKNGIHVLVVTNMESVYDAHVLLGEKVFGPVLYEFDRTTDVQIWTKRELKAAKATNNEILRRVSTASVSIYGSPDAAFDYAKPSVS